MPYGILGDSSGLWASSVSYDCVIGFGSNQGDRRRILALAAHALAAQARIRALSSLYETEPIGGPVQPDFLNAAARLDWSRPLSDLLFLIQHIETRFARQRLEPWGPRTLDLDILWVDGVHVALPDLAVPHPKLLERAFALVPLLEVAPRAVDPSTGKPYSAVVMPAGRLRLVATPDWA